jgi:hypothetical protein
VEHKNLAIAIGSGADADRWNAEFFGDAGGKLARDGFQNHRERPSGFHCFCIALKLLRGVDRFTLDVKSA